MPEIGVPHKLTHQDGGNDEISLTGLSGLLGDPQTPLAHKTSHQDGGADEIDVTGLAGQLVIVPYNAKIADINEDDTDKHFLDLATALSETREIIGVWAGPQRISGTGVMIFYPNEGATNNVWSSSMVQVPLSVIAAGTNRLRYAQSVANDDFDVYCFGYVVER